MTRRSQVITPQTDLANVHADLKTALLYAISAPPESNRPQMESDHLKAHAPDSVAIVDEMRLQLANSQSSICSAAIESLRVQCSCYLGVLTSLGDLLDRLDDDFTIWFAVARDRHTALCHGSGLFQDKFCAPLENVEPFDDFPMLRGLSSLFSVFINFSFLFCRILFFLFFLFRILPSFVRCWTFSHVV